MSAGTRRAIVRSLAPLALMAAIFYLSAQHADADQAWWTVIFRKFGHIGGYAALTALWAWALAGVVRRPVLAAVAISLLYACTDEYHQSFVETRHGSPIDVGIDAIGMAIAALAIKGSASIGRSTRRAQGLARDPSRAA